jgi:hypothetical protein
MTYFFFTLSSDKTKDLAKKKESFQSLIYLTIFSKITPSTTSQTSKLLLTFASINKSQDFRTAVK